MTHGLPYDSDLEEDRNGDGVELMMAYALNLDPNENLAGALPKAQIDESNLSIDFYASASGIVYAVETSHDLRTWTRESVTLSEIDADGFRRASVPRLQSRQFLRLSVMWE